MTEKLMRVEITEQKTFHIYILFEPDDYPPEKSGRHQLLNEKLKDFAYACLRDYKEEARRSRGFVSPDMEADGVSAWEIVDIDTEEASYAYKHKAPPSVSRLRNAFLRALVGYEDPYKREAQDVRLHPVGDTVVARQVKFWNPWNHDRWITVEIFDLSYEAEGVSDIDPEDVAQKLDAQLDWVKEKLIAAGIIKKEEEDGTPENDEASPEA